MLYRHLKNGLWKISAKRREHIERWMKRKNYEQFHLQIIHRHGFYTIYLGRSNLGRVS